MATRAPSYALPGTIIPVSPQNESQRRTFQYTPVNALARENVNGDPAHHKHAHAHAAHSSHDNGLNASGHKQFSSYLGNSQPDQAKINQSMPKTTRPRGESDLGRPPSGYRTVSTAYSFPNTSSASELDTLNEATSASFLRLLPLELLYGILVPLPFLLASLIHPSTISIDHNRHSQNTEAAEEVIDEVTGGALAVSTKSSGLVQACALASGTLVLVGLIGRFAARMAPLERRKSGAEYQKDTQSVPANLFSTASLRQMAIRMASITLPYLATVEIGGARTGMFLLACIAGGLISPGDQSTDQPKLKPWKRALKQNKWTFLVLILSLLVDLFWLKTNAEPSSTARGYIALAKSTLFLRLPKPFASRGGKIVSPLIKSRADTDRTIIAGVLLGGSTFVLSILLSASPIWTTSSMSLSMSSMAFAAVFLVYFRPVALRSLLKTGFVCGSIVCLVFQTTSYGPASMQTPALTGLLSLLYIAVQLDTKAFSSRNMPGTTSRRASTYHNKPLPNASSITHFLLHRTEDMPLLHSILLEKESRRIVYFMGINLGFMFIQTFYALVAGSLGLLSDSIHMLFDCVGLLAGLIASIMSKWPPNARFPYGYGKVETLSGLGNGIFLMIISVEIIWESIERFAEGAQLHRLNELMVVSVGGLVVNCLGLLFIGHHHHGHSHGHSHDHGHGHSHSHSHHSHNHSHDHHDHPHYTGHENGLAHSHVHHPNSHEHHHDTHHHGHDEKHSHENHSEHSHANGTFDTKMLEKAENRVNAHHHHDHEHHSGHANENMAGIYLHILADTMGSVAVIASTILTKYTGWSGWDPIASFIIAVLILLASWPLVVGSAKQLILTVPNEVEYRMRNALQEIPGLRGVAAYAVPRLWLDDSEAGSEDHHHHHHGHDHHHSHGCSPNEAKICGVIHVIATPSADMNDVKDQVQHLLRDKNIDALIHVEREGNSNCWCGGSRSTTSKGGHIRNRSTVVM